MSEIKYVAKRCREIEGDGETVDAITAIAKAGGINVLEHCDEQFAVMRLEDLEHLLGLAGIELGPL